MTLVLRTGETIPVERASKIAIAHRIFDEMMKLRLALHSFPMNRDQLRERLNFYRDLGIDEIFRRKATVVRQTTESPDRTSRPLSSSRRLLPMRRRTAAPSLW